ncbi:MAG: ATP-binding protein [Pseudodesulfovibrio sp.]
MHRLLKRQLKQLYKGEDIPKELAGILELVGESYAQFDEDRELIDRATRLSSHELVQRNSEMRAMFQAFPDRFAWVNPWGTIIDCKGGVQDEVAIDAKAICGEKIYDIPIAGDRSVFGLAVKKAVRNREASLLEYPVVIGDDIHHYEARFIPLVDDVTLVIFRNITQRKRNEDELVQHRDHLGALVEARTRELELARDAAEDANLGKGEFLANMSHEIRTPLNGVMGMLQLTKTTVLDGEQNDYVETALTSCRNLMRIINDVLDFSKIEAGRLEIVHMAFSLSDVVDPVVAVMQPLVQEKGLELDVYVAPGDDSYVGDEGRLRQVLFNLMGNAVKFTEHGKVGVSITPVTHGPDDTRLLLTVSDTGIGIPDNRIAYLFEAFTQNDGSYTRPYQGTGLGLGIVKRLVELMGGGVSMESAEGEGTTVRCTVRVTRSDYACDFEEKHSTTYPPRPLSILLTEDDRVSRVMAQRLLEKMGHTVSTARNGQEALDHMKIATFDCILMDVQMPVMNGLEATAAIREIYGDIPIIGLTAHALDTDRLRFIKAGMNDCLTKPFEREDAGTMLARWTVRG